MEYALASRSSCPLPKSLRGEVGRWQSVWQSKYQEMQEARKREQECKKAIPNNLLLALGACDSRLNPNVHRLLLIARRLPITSVEVERSVCLLRRLKTSTIKVYHGRGASCTPICYSHALQRPSTSRQSLYKIIHGDCSYSLCLKET